MASVWRVWLLVLVVAVPAFGQDEPSVQTGVFATSFDEKSPLSDADAMSKISGWAREQMPGYDPVDHTFQMIVPEGYDGSEDYGLLVFIHPNSQVDLRQFYGLAIKDVLAKHKLIWVSFSGAGNPVMPNIRLGLALDAVHNVQQRYAIDEDRVYVSGLSGGGRMTCMAAMYYPQVFTGAAPIVGTLYFRDAKLPEDPALRSLIRPEPPEGVAVWPRGLLKPSARNLRDMKKGQRWVLIAGERDYNMPQMRAHFEQGFERDGFEHAHYLEVAGMGHTYPSADWFEKALGLLDDPLAEQDPADLPPADARTQRLAQRRLDVALRTLERDEARGVRALKRLIEDLPNTDAADQAREKLAAIEGA